MRFTPDARIGFTNHWLHNTTLERPETLAERDATLKHVASFVTTAERERFLDKAATANVRYALEMAQLVSQLPETERMMRLGSGMFPLYQTPFGQYYKHGAKDAWVYLKQLGQLARDAKIRLSFHPGQWVTINRPGNDFIAARAHDEIDYHAHLLQVMGLRGTDGAVINIHGGGTECGIEGLARGWRDLSSHSREYLTVENDEFIYGVDDLLQLWDLDIPVPIVFDMHHHWISSAGQYLDPEGPTFERVLKTWQFRGCRPKVHYAFSFPEFVTGLDEYGRPDYMRCIGDGMTRTQLRRHGMMPYNTATNDWALRFLQYADVMVEAKGKNAASAVLADQYYKETGHGRTDQA